VFEGSKFITTDPPNLEAVGNVAKGDVWKGNTWESYDVVSRHGTLLVLATILSCFYTGCHALAWNWHFPTYIERWIWWGSCMLIPIAIPATLVLYRATGDDGIMMPIITVPVVLLMISIMCSYLLARAFIVVSSFISIQSLPVRAYETVNWINFWPHI